MQKGQLGQFYTTRYDYILSNMSIPDFVKKIIEPFVGSGDLLQFIKNKELYTIECYDIDPHYDNAIQQDTLLHPPSYENTFVLTNPPYLARNKSTDKTLYDKYECNDLYKCFLYSLIQDVCQGGIIILPLNFMCSIRKADVELRKQFLSVYSIQLVNIFEEQVFDDTSYAVCSMYFINKSSDYHVEEDIQIHIYPSKKELTLKLNEDNNYTIGGEIYKLPMNSTYKIQRATKTNQTNMTNILLKCIDDSATTMLGFQYVSDEKRFIDSTPKLSARSYATLLINTELTSDQQKALVKNMNEYIKDKRMKYNSLFLTNYRDSNTIARKRISFDLAFKICNHVLTQSKL